MSKTACAWLKAISHIALSMVAPLLLGVSQAAATPHDALSAPPSEIIFVESNVADYRALLDGVNQRAEVHVLDAAGDGLAQMAEVLRGRSGLDAIHLISHGSEGALQLGALTLSGQNLASHFDGLAVIGKALRPGGDLLIYGCSVAGSITGRQFVEDIAAATGAHVAASSNDTGAQRLGGDWDLEVRTAPIATPTLAAVGYTGLLATGTLNFSSDGGWAGGIATDGQGGSTDLAGIAIEVSDISDTSGTNLGTSIEWYDNASLGVPAGGFNGLTTFFYADGATPWKGMRIKSSDGSDFQINSFKWYDWSWTGGTVNVVGYRDGSQVTSTSFTANSDSTVVTVNLDSTFDAVDDVRITYASGGGYPTINAIAIADAVVTATAPGAPTSPSATAGNAQASVTFTAPASNGGATITTYTATASPGGATGTCAGPAACSITVTGLTNGTAYTFTVTATNSAGTGAASSTSNSVTPKAPQTITFNNPGAQNFGTTPTLTATATSGLTVSFSSSTTGVCTITSGGTLTFITAGTCTINAAQAGNGTYTAATTISQSFTVNAVVPGAPTIGTATAGDTQASISFSAPAFNGGSGILGYTVTSSPGGLTGTGAASPITVTGLINGTAYTFTVTATNSAGTGPASAASNSVTPKATQSITFNNPGAQNFGTTPTLSATSNSGLTVNFTSSTTGICTITSGGALTFVTTGTCTINADQAGNSAYQAASTVIQSFTVNSVVPGAPTIGSATAGDTQATVSFTAPVSTGGTTITGYTVTSSPGGFTGTGFASPITVTGLTNGTAYTFTVTATNSAGTGSASAASNSVTPKATQSITFNNPGAQNFGTTPTLTATATSGLTVSFTSSTTAVCTITSGGALTFVTTGTCTINTNQAGNSAYLAASTVVQSFTVNAVVPGAPTIGSATAGNTQATVGFTASVSTGGATITGYTVTSNPGGFTGTGAASPITVTGLTNGTAYTFTVTATNSAGTGPASAASNSVTPKGIQTITFANPGAQNFGTTPTLTATSNSGLTVSFTSSTTGVCTITSGGALTFVTTGSCTVNADQAGNVAYLAASTVSQSFSVNAAVPGAPTIGTATAGNAQASVSFSAPAASGGGTITGYTVTSNPGGLTGTGTASPITVTGLTNGTAYTFTVTATNSAGTGSASAASNSVTPATVPGAPTIASVTAGNAQVSVNFTAPASNGGSAITGYTVTSSPGAHTATGAASPIAVTGLSNGTAYTFTVTATNGVGTGNASAASSSVTPATVPGAPIIGPPVAGNAQVTVNFTAPASDGGSPITAYTVTSSPGGLTGTGAASPITVTGLVNGTAYSFTVRATNVMGTGSPSASTGNVTPATVPGAPTIGTATAGSTQATVSFTAPASNGGITITNYTVTSSPGGHTGMGATSPITVTGLTNGTTYTFTVTASNGVGTGSASAASNSVTPAALPGAPTIGTATAGNAQATVSFSTPGSNGGSAITGYTVTSSPGGLTGTGGASPITVTGLTNGTAYTFTVTATNIAGTGSASAASNSVTPKGTQTITFNNPGAQNFGTAPTLSATSGSGLAPSFSSSTPSVCTITSGGTLTLVAVGTCVIAADQAGNGSFVAAPQVSRSFSVNAVVPGAPTGLAAVAGKAQATVSFTAPAFTGGAPVTGYTVIATPGGVTASGASSPLTVTGLTNGTAYTFTAVATNSAGNSAASSPSNSVTPVSGPDITAPADITVDAVGLFTPVDIGTATVAESGITPTVTQVNGRDVMAKPTHFRPGANTVTWSATDSAGHSGTAVQRVNVRPLVDFNKSQVSAEGATATFKVVLNGPAVSYPVTVPYTVGGTASTDGSDHDLVDGSVVINAPNLEASVDVHFVNDGVGEGTETLMITMGTPTNAVAGHVKTHTIEIREGNVAPAVRLSATQGSGVTRLIDQRNGVVTVTAAVTDPNVGDTHSYSWSGTDNALIDTDAVANTFTFDPAGLTPGVYRLKVSVSDGTATGDAELLLMVKAALPALTAVDSDGDGVNDDVEGAGDSDNDGIPDYLDNSSLSRNVVQEKQAMATQFLTETEPGLFISLGQVAFRASGNKVGVSETEVQTYANDGAGAVQDKGQTFSGGLFDFEVSELPVAGQQAKVVLAQFAPIPAKAVYRKLTSTGWQAFVIDANDAIASAAGAEGYCPPPGDSAYTPGLTEGHWCVQLTIQDGGPNDADGVADGHIADPGGVGQQIDQPTPVITGGGGATSHWLLLLLATMLLRRSRGRRLLMSPRS